MTEEMSQAYHCSIVPLMQEHSLLEILTKKWENSNVAKNIIQSK